MYHGATLFLRRSLCKILVYYGKKILAKINGAEKVPHFCPSRARDGYFALSVVNYKGRETKVPRRRLFRFSALESFVEV